MKEMQMSKLLSTERSTSHQLLLSVRCKQKCLSWLVEFSADELLDDVKQPVQQKSGHSSRGPHPHELTSSCNSLQFKNITGCCLLKQGDNWLAINKH